MFSKPKKPDVNPEEFLHRPIDLTPLIDAAIRRDWKTVKVLLNMGYSLAWRDNNLKMTAIRYLSMQPDCTDIIKYLIQYSAEMNGIDSAAHEYILIEQRIGGINNLNGSCSVMEIIDYYNIRSNEIKYLRWGDMEVGLFDLSHAEDPQAEATANSIFHLMLGNHHDVAFQHLSRLNKTEINDGIQSIMKVAGTWTQKDWQTIVDRTNDTLKEPYQNAVHIISMAEALANCPFDWPFTLLDKIIKYERPGQIEIMGEAIISAARSGRFDIITNLCERAKQAMIDQDENFVRFLSCSVGAALVNDHYELAKAIMQRVPSFQVTPADLIELNKWPLRKIERMFHIMHDQTLFAAIARHPGLANSPAWTEALNRIPALEHLDVVKKNVGNILFKYIHNERHFKSNKEIVIDLADSLNNVDSSSVIEELLRERLESSSPHQKLLNQCIAVLKKHDVDISSTHVLSK